MKLALFIWISLLAASTAQYHNSLSRPQYDAPQAYGAPRTYGPPIPQYQSLQEQEDEYIPTVKQVYVYVAPDDRSSGVTRVIKAPIKRERQVNIIFVKAPAPAAPDRQIVEIPNDGGRKTLVYVLLKKTDATPDVDFKLPKPTQASKPEIYFIRYKDGTTGPASGTQVKYGVPALGRRFRTPSGSKPYRT